MLKKYIDYAETTDQFLIDWINTVVKNRIKKEAENQGEIEHIIDYLKSDSAPKKIKKMSYTQAKEASEKWVLSLRKKGSDINETAEDTEVILDFNDGMKMVRLIGDNAFKREGFLMSHCVAGYAGKDTIYSLRDKDNMPHCTIEWGNQIKGKGNGCIHPKYIDYVVRFLESKNMPMRDSEFENLGYFRAENSFEEQFLDTHFPNAKKYRNNLYFVESLK